MVKASGRRTRLSHSDGDGFFARLRCPNLLGIAKKKRKAEASGGDGGVGKRGKGDPDDAFGAWVETCDEGLGGGLRHIFLFRWRRAKELPHRRGKPVPTAINVRKIWFIVVA